MSLIFWRQVFRRWFVEYNPLYLLATAVLTSWQSKKERALSSLANAPPMAPDDDGPAQCR